MGDILLGVLLLLQLLLGVLGLMLYRRVSSPAGGNPQEGLARLGQELERVTERVDRQLGDGIERLERRLSEEGRQGRMENSEQARTLREENARTLKEAGELLSRRSGETADLQRSRLEDFATRLGELRQSNEATLNAFSESLLTRMAENANLQKNQLDGVLRQFGDLKQANERRLEELRLTLENRLDTLRQENAAKLEQMRTTVDEKLTGTLEKRLGESFRQVSERLEQVHAGLGEMRSLTSGVGDLKRVLTNVKTRGIWGEIQLANLLGQVLTPDQYATNVATLPNSRETVEFAIRLPGRGEGEAPVWLPIDSKFPEADYEKIRLAAEAGDKAALEQAEKDFTATIRRSAKDIHEKYVGPPHTTDFGILFVPTEGLYAEILRQLGLTTELQEKYRIVVAGPTTLTALLNSLQMGFRTLAIEKRSSEVWHTLGAIKTEFAKFGSVLNRLKRQLETATRTIETINTRKRVMERKLQGVEQVSAEESYLMLGLDATGEDEPDEEDGDGEE